MTRQSITRGVLWAVIAATTLFIWSWSLNPVDVSLAQSDAVRGFLSTLLGNTAIGSWLLLHIRKVGHFAEFALLGIEWGVARRLYGRRLRWALLLAGPLVGACDELLQFTSAGRGPQVSDVLLDTVGYAVGAAAVWAVGALRDKRVKKDDLG